MLRVLAMEGIFFYVAVVARLYRLLFDSQMIFTAASDTYLC